MLRGGFAMLRGGFAVLGRRPLRRGFAVLGRRALRRHIALLGRAGGRPLRARSANGSHTLRRRLTVRRRCALCCGCALCGRRLATLRPIGMSSTSGLELRRQALREALYCERVLAKTGDSVLHKTLGPQPTVTAWSHFPSGDVYDPESGAQWYYHCHPPAEGAVEHGHFHCFVRPDGRDGPVHHLVAVGVDPRGHAIRLFTVNHWVVGDHWLDAGPTVALLPRFALQLDRPSYLVNRWLTAVVQLYADEIAGLIRARDEAIARHGETAGVEAARADRTLEVTSEMAIDLSEAAGHAGDGTQPPYR